jgi:hypothetical protein
MAVKSIWTVIPRADVNLEEMVELPFGRFNEALPYVSAFISSDAIESDFVHLDASARGKLQRALVKLSGVKLNKRTEKRDGTKLEKPVEVIDNDSVQRAEKALGIEIVRHASASDDTELMSLRKVAA